MSLRCPIRDNYGRSNWGLYRDVTKMSGRGQLWTKKLRTITLSPRTVQARFRSK